MRLIERYLLRQMLGPTLLATAALGMVALLSQSLSVIDIVVDHHQGALVFLKIVLLAMPQLVALIMPIALFTAALVALNRLHTEQEIVVCFAGGMSRWRVVAPAVRLAASVCVLTLAVNLWIQPLCARAMRAEVVKVRTDLAATLVRPNEFTHPAAGLTVYAQNADQTGSLRNLFVHQENPGGGDSTFIAREGDLAERNGSPILIMRQGSNQSFSPSGVLNYLRFDEYIFDLAPFAQAKETLRYKPSDRYLHELFWPDLTQKWDRDNRERLLAEGNARLASPLYSLAFMAMALAAVLGGTFSRLGYGRSIAAAAAAAAVVRIVGFGVQAGSESAVWMNPFQYLIPVAAAAWAFHRLFRQRVGRTIPLAHRADPLGAGAPA